MAISPSLPSKPAFVLVSGAWHGTSYWAKVVAGLLREGYTATPVALRSASPKPTTTFMDDVDAVRDVIRGDVTRGCDVVVVAHSLGTVVGASAIQGFARLQSDGRENGNSTVVTTAMAENQEGCGRVIGFVALATGFLPASVCFLQALGGKPPPLWRFSSEPRVTTEDDVDDDGEDTTKAFVTIRVSAREAFYHDLPIEEGEQWVERLAPQCVATVRQGGEHVYAGWLDGK